METMTQEQFNTALSNAEVIDLRGDFVKEYNALCDKYGYSIQAVPAFRHRDDGTFSVIIQYNVVELRGR